MKFASTNFIVSLLSLVTTPHLWQLVEATEGGLRSTNAERELQGATGICKYSDSSCSLDSLSGKDHVAIVPGGDARCGLDTKEDGSPNPYFFQVDPGRNGQENNLIIAFQGGGAFLGYEKGDISTAKRSPSISTFGIFDREQEDNPFRDWTKVQVTYCTGDLHVGQGADVDPKDGTKYSFNGRNNAMIVFRWIQANIPRPERVLLFGCSAGSSGVQFWSNQILNYLEKSSTPPITTAVVMDSNTGLNRPEDGTLEASVSKWKVCSQALGLSKEEVELCRLGLFSLTDIQLKSQAAHRETPFAYTTFKDDPTLSERYCGPNDELCDQPEFYADQNAHLNGFVQEENNNVLTFWVNQPGHCMVNVDLFYTLKAKESLRDWVTNVALHDGANPPLLQSDCVDFNAPPGYDGSCDANLLAATFVPP